MDFEAKAREIAHRYLTMPNENHHCDEPITPYGHIFVCNALTAAIAAALSLAAKEEREACAKIVDNFSANRQMLTGVIVAVIRARGPSASGEDSSPSALQSSSELEAEKAHSERLGLALSMIALGCEHPKVVAMKALKWSEISESQIEEQCAENAHCDDATAPQTKPA